MRFILVIFLSLSLISFRLEGDHKFYVSTTVVAENPRTQNVEITIKLFTDDFELALEKANSMDDQIRLGTEDESEDIDLMVEQYIRDNFTMSFDGRDPNWSYIGFETEYDLTFVYFEIVPTPNFSALDISNKLLLDQFEEQVNITHLRFSGWEQTLYFDQKMPERVITK